MSRLSASLEERKKMEPYQHCNSRASLQNLQAGVWLRCKMGGIVCVENLFKIHGWYSGDL